MDSVDIVPDSSVKADRSPMTAVKAPINGAGDAAPQTVTSNGHSELSAPSDTAQPTRESEKPPAPPTALSEKETATEPAAETEKETTVRPSTESEQSIAVQPATESEKSIAVQPATEPEKGTTPSIAEKEKAPSNAEKEKAPSNAEKEKAPSNAEKEKAPSNAEKDTTPSIVEKHTVTQPTSESDKETTAAVEEEGESMSVDDQADGEEEKMEGVEEAGTGVVVKRGKPAAKPAKAKTPSSSSRLSVGRERKQVTRLEVVAEAKSRRSSVTAPGTGRGIRLEECPVIVHNITKADPDDLHALHRIMFGRPGKTYEFRRNIRQFNGFPFDKDSAEYNRKLESVSRYMLNVLRGFVKLFDLKWEKGQMTREVTIEMIMDFLMEPKMSERKLNVSKKSPRKKSAAGKSNTKSAVDTEEEGHASTDKSPSKKAASKPAAKSKKAAAAAKQPVKSSPRKRKAASTTGSDDEAPLKKKTKKPPTDGEIRALVKKLLAGANLEQVTMKNILTQVYDKYPEHDLTVKKDFIKGIVKSLIS